MTIVQELPRQEQHIRMSYEAFLTQIDENVHSGKRNYPMLSSPLRGS